METPVVYYRELAPCDALRNHVRSFFSFAPGAVRERASVRRVLREVEFACGDSFSSPFFADGHVSIVVSFDRACGPDGRWYTGVTPAAAVIGPMSVVGPVRPADRADMVGVYFQPGKAASFLGAPSSLLTDRTVALEELWGAAQTEPLLALVNAGEATRVERLERALLARLRRTPRDKRTVNVAGLADWAAARSGQLTVEQMAGAAGVSRQALTRAFRDEVGVTPKLYCMLARFQSGLGFAGSGNDVNWAHAAAELGYADQSHMITEFRRFSSLTPYQLASSKWFHPFIERAKAR
jgi:AraC-like DNA-binding protein